MTRFEILYSAHSEPFGFGQGLSELIFLLAGACTMPEPGFLKSAHGVNYTPTLWGSNPILLSCPAMADRRRSRSGSRLHHYRMGMTCSRSVGRGLRPPLTPCACCLHSHSRPGRSSEARVAPERCQQQPGSAVGFCFPAAKSNGGSASHS